MRRLTLLLALLFLALSRRGDAQGVVVRRTDIQRRVNVNPALLERAKFVTAGIADTLKTDSMRVRPGDVVVVPTGQTATRDSSTGSDPDAHVDLPVRLLTVDRSGTQLLTLTIRVAPEGAGLTFDAGTQSFSGTVLIGIEDSLRKTEQITLGRAMELQITSDADHVDPPTIRIVHTNIPWQRVRLVARSPRDTVQVRIRAVFDPEGYAAPILVDRPRIDVRPASTNV